MEKAEEKSVASTGGTEPRSGHGAASPLPTSPDPTSWLDSPLAKLAGAAAGVAFTVATAAQETSKAFFKSYNKGGAFDDLQKERDKQIAAILAPAIKDQHHINSGPTVADINRHYEAELIKRQELLGVNDLASQWKVLKTHQRKEVLFTTAAVASVALGAILAIASNRSTSMKADKILKNEEEPQRS